MVTDPKQIDKLPTGWNKEVKSEYNPEDEEDDNSEFMQAVKEWSLHLDFVYDADEACAKIIPRRLPQWWYSRIRSLDFFLLYKTKLSVC